MGENGTKSRKLSKKGEDFIASFEGEILKVYDDGFGYPTLGIGHLLTPEERKLMPLGTTITKEQSREYFRRDVPKYEAAVNKAVSAPLTQNQFDALVSLCFNIGIGAFVKSSAVRHLNAGRYADAADAILRFNKAKGKIVPGLDRRRKAERKLFMTPDSAAASANPSENKQPAVTESNAASDSVPESTQQGNPPNEPPPDVFNTIEQYGEKFGKVDAVASKVSGASWFMTLTTKFSGLALLGWESLKENWVGAAIGAALIIAALWYYKHAKERADMRSNGGN